MPRRLAVGQHIADVRFVDHLGAAAVLGRRQADVHVDAERLGDLGAQVLADGAPGHPADHLAEDETEGHHVIALRGAGLPPRLGGRDVGAHRVPVGGVGPMQPSARSDDAGAMPQHHRDGDVLLAGLAELRPVPRHRGVQVELHRGRPADGRRCWSAPWSRSRCWPGCLPRHGRRPAASAKPPHRLTTRSPSTQTATAAPMSSRSVKFEVKASRTRSKPGAHEPSTGTPDASSKDPPAGHAPVRSGRRNRTRVARCSFLR